ncbi:MAG: DNA recombination protein RmuC [Elusimicrobia bacterium HGW-Elusimicrobia-1]|jgi:DNA recombination protein RmuC|nr:MAG: DNA recombination protein RmuC [Elusimicrobia bacterium HGW-Elusimicrobia-1]
METALIIILAALALASGFLFARLKIEKARNDSFAGNAERERESARNEFSVLAAGILEDKTKKLTEENERKISAIIEPLKTKISEFQKQVSDAYDAELRDKVSLKTEIKNLTELNRRLSEGAENLAGAIKGDSKLQGDWGEMQLELILERAGLEKNIHYSRQETIRDADGNLLRPDYIVRLPDDKVLIIDSKVSLKDYESYFNASDETSKEMYLKKHVESILGHIKDLSAKSYDRIYGVSSPDYVLMFVPLESALYSALKKDPSLLTKALEKNVALVSTSTMLHALRTIGFIWKQENQRKNVFEIARESGQLYDKFVGFVDDLADAAKKIDSAGVALEAAMNKLKTSARKGDTIIGRIERIKSLGADAAKSLPPELSDDIRENSK